jgi:ribosomal protein S18 acetylase RimI-like enzyme
MSEVLHFRAVQPDEFDAFVAAAKATYVQDMVTNGSMSVAEATAKAERDFAAALPAALATPGHTLLFIVDTHGARIGRLWFGERPPAVYLYAIWLDEAVRGRGLGRQAMEWLEHETRRRGLDRIELNVFGGNTTARRLYESLAYREVAISMRKDIAPL